MIGDGKSGKEGGGESRRKRGRMERGIVGAKREIREGGREGGVEGKEEGGREIV